MKLFWHIFLQVIYSTELFVVYVTECLRESAMLDLHTGKNDSVNQTICCYNRCTYIFCGKRKWEGCQFFHPIDLVQWAWSRLYYTNHHTLGSGYKYNMTYRLWWKWFPLLGIYTSVCELNVEAFLSKNSLQWICSREREREKNQK